MSSKQTPNTTQLVPFKEGEFKSALKQILEKQYNLTQTEEELQQSVDNLNLFLESFGLRKHNAKE